MFKYVCVRAFVHACVRVCVRECVRASVRACVLRAASISERRHGFSLQTVSVCILVSEQSEGGLA